MKALKCTKCDKSFKTKQALSSHKRTHQNNESIIENKCHVCDKVIFEWSLDINFPIK